MNIKYDAPPPAVNNGGSLNVYRTWECDHYVGSCPT